MRSLIQKTLKYIGIFAVILFVGFFLWLQFGIYVITNGAEREAYIKVVTAAPQLPKNFIKVYSKVYPERINGNVYKLILYRFFGERYNIPSLDISQHYMSSRRRGDLYNIVVITSYTERNFSQEQCLNFYFQYLDFTHNNIGIEAASQYFYKQPLNGLSDEQILELIVMEKNPSLYDRNKRDNGLFRGAYDVLKHKYDSGS